MTHAPTQSPVASGLAADYAPADQWPTLNVLDGHGFSDYDLPGSDALAGRELRAAFDGGATLTVTIDDAGSATWADGDQQVTLPVFVKEVDSNLYLLHSAVEATSVADAVSWVLVADLDSGAVTVVRSTMVLDADRSGPAAQEEVHTGSLDGRSARHERTSELVGQRVLYVYGPDNAYEHIYLTESSYTWQCLAGAERGLADTDRGRVWKLRDKIYLFAWQEKVVPCDGIVAINFQRGRSTGRIWGWDTDAQASNSIAMGAREQVLNTTTYDSSAWAQD